MTSIRLVRAELLKIRTTNAWWIFALCTVAADGLVLAMNLVRTHYLLKLAAEAIGKRSESAQLQLALRTHTLRLASDIFNSGGLIGGLFAMLFAILLVSSEYHHQTVTTTFLTTPRRTPVILAKLVAGVLAAGAFWSISAAISIPAGLIFFQSEHLPSHLGEWEVIRSILLNLMVYGLWAVFGIGFGALIRNQLAATISATLGYLVGGQVAQAVFVLVHQFWIKEDWVLTARVIVPAQAAEIALSPIKTYPQSAPQWVGAAVLIAYGLVFGAIGTFILRRRDVS